MEKFGIRPTQIGEKHCLLHYFLISHYNYFRKINPKPRKNFKCRKFFSQINPIYSEDMFQFTPSGTSCMNGPAEPPASSGMRSPAPALHRDVSNFTLHSEFF